MFELLLVILLLLAIKLLLTMLLTTFLSSCKRLAIPPLVTLSPSGAWLSGVQKLWASAEKKPEAESIAFLPLASTILSPAIRKRLTLPDQPTASCGLNTE